jgi:putative membrane protein insertion efficiency factor
VTWLARLVLAGITGYQWLISPLVGSACRFAPTCSEYARRAVIDHGVFWGIWLASRRLLRCHPFHPGGFDPPPPSGRRRV